MGAGPRPVVETKLEIARRGLGAMSFGERLLLAVSYHPAKVCTIELHEVPTGEWTVEFALETLRQSFAGLDDLIRGKQVEPPRVCRRLVGLSRYAATAVFSSLA